MKYPIFLAVLLLFSSIGFASDTNGPMILTDFNFDKTHYGPQEIDFYCWSQTENECINQTKYMLDGLEYDFTFGEITTFDFIGTKSITIFAKDTNENETTKTFVLTIAEGEAPEEIIEETDEDEIDPEVGGELIEETEEEIISTQKETIPIEETESKEEISETNSNIEQEKSTFLAEKEEISNNRSLPFSFELNQKDKIYIILLTIILVLLVAVFYKEKPRVKM